MSCVVTLTLFDVDGVETTDAAGDADSYVYTVEVPTAISAPSVESIIVVPTTTTATVDIVYPADRQLSTPPISGKFFIECTHPDGSSYPTQDLDIYSANEWNVWDQIEADCSYLKNKIQVTRLTSTYANRALGVEFEINFIGMDASLGLFKMHNSYTDPVVVDTDNGVTLETA